MCVNTEKLRVLFFLLSDKEKFGVKLMEKMGWSAGKGLGANEHGSVDPIKVSLKSDNRGRISNLCTKLS